jgi:hypothetical protein
MLRDSVSNFAFFQAVMPQEFVATDLTGYDIDTQGYESLTFVINVGNLSIITSVSYIQLIMQHTDASALGAGPSDYALVSATDVIGLASTITSLTSGVFKTIGAEASGTLSALGSRVFQIGYRGTKRYVRLYIDAVDTVNAVSDAISAIAMLGYPANWPIAGNLEQAIDYIG